MAEWDAEIEVDASLARTLIAGRFPALDVRALQLVGEGWDNTVWATAENIAFRFPRRAIAIPGLKREIAILPALSSRLPNAVPNAAYPAEPSREFPWPWFGSRLIHGTEIARADLGSDRRERLAADLGRFLGCLHELCLPIAQGLDVDPLGRADMSARIPRTRAALDQVASLWDGADRAELVLRAAGHLAPDDDLVIVHGDLNQRHALVSPSGGLAGVIDWGDLCQAPRSVDLALHWSVFDQPARAAFRAAYGALTEATLARARVLALFFDAALAAYAQDKGLDALKREALRGLNRTVAD